MDTEFNLEKLLEALQGAPTHCPRCGKVSEREIQESPSTGSLFFTCICGARLEFGKIVVGRMALTPRYNR